MKKDQENIYFVAGGSEDEVKKSPFAERLLKKGYEVRAGRGRRALALFFVKDTSLTFFSFSLPLATTFRVYF